MFLAASSALLLGALPCGAADRILVSMTSSQHGEIKGEIASKHGSMEALRFAEEYTLTTGGAGGGSGKLERAPIVFTKRVDKATPIIFQAFVKTEMLPSVVFNFVREPAKGDEAYYTIKLVNARVVKLTHSAASEGPAATPLVETVSLQFDRIEKTSKSVSADGKVSTDVSTFNFVASR